MRGLYFGGTSIAVFAFDTACSKLLLSHHDHRGVIGYKAMLYREIGNGVRAVPATAEVVVHGMVVSGWLSMNCIKAFHENIRKLAREFEQQKHYDKVVPDEYRRGTTMIVAIKPWALEIFERYAREE